MPGTPAPPYVSQLETPHGAILCDEEVADRIDIAWFDVEHWRRQGGADATPAGRGAAAFVETPAGPMVLRRYLRGGLAARLSRDRYLFTGADRTRGFAEFRMLAKLRRAGLRVPQPLAAMYRRHGLFYAAAILVARIEGVTRLCELLDRADHRLFAHVGRAIGDLHRQRVWHADLNADNILLDEGGDVWLVDFDRARVRDQPGDGAWALGNLARLRRSMFKFEAPRRMADFEGAWAELLRGHAVVLRGTDRPLGKPA
ncbi:MAG TPA: 3-deoxy-D-manno-octulosonic acid kinase [Xanthomonadaceae bacterium]|nr:3-deoxy-D-manno-octulosonic acid kinase [Xanthomonadaceae bacterium]